MFLGLGFFLAIFPVFFGSTYLARQVLRLSTHHDPILYLVHAHPLPTWAITYSLLIWWVIWSPTEEATYQAYALPRLRALTGRTWIAVATVGFCWAAQHCLLPFVADWRYLVFRFFSFLPGCLVLMFLYMRTRRLTPLIVAHWPMDIAAAIVTVIH